MDIDIEKEFIMDFDQLLIDCNNPNINSYERYGKYKNKYIEYTKTNIRIYNQLKNELYIINPPVEPTSFKYYYTFVDNEKIINIKNEIKKIIIEQKQYYNNFLNYIMTLNTEYANSVNVQRSQLTRTNSRSSSHSAHSMSRGLLSKLLPKSKTESKRVRFKFLRNTTK